MKKIIVCAFILLSAPAFAEDAKSGDKMMEHKADILAGIDKHIAALQEHKTCVSGASDKEAMKKCHDKMKEFRQENRGDMMEKRHERMGEKMKMHEERMKKMNEKNDDTDK